MKLLRVIPSMDPAIGGPCQGIRNSILGLEKLGVYNEVVCLDAPDALYLGKDSFIIHTLGPANKSWSYSPKLIPWLYENVGRFDAIILHGLWQYHTYGVHKVFQNLKKELGNVPQLFIMPHGMLDPWFQKDKSRRLKALRNWFYWKLIEKNVINDSDGVLFTCEEELRLARETFSSYTPKKELNVSYGIVAPPIFIPRMTKIFMEKCPNLNGKPFLLFLSRIHPKKGVDLLIKAYLRLKKEGYSLPKLVIAGPGLDSVYGDNVMKLASVDKDILFPGMLRDDEKWGAFYNCEAFILPSHQENFGIAVVEAMACHKPVLISNQINIWREISEGNAGMISSDNEDSVHDMVLKWLKFSEYEKKEKGLNAYLTFVNLFSVEKSTKRMADILFKNVNLQTNV